MFSFSIETSEELCYDTIFSHINKFVKRFKLNAIYDPSLGSYDYRFSKLHTSIVLSVEEADEDIFTITLNTNAEVKEFNKYYRFFQKLTREYYVGD